MYVFRSVTHELPVSAIFLQNRNWPSPSSSSSFLLPPRFAAARDQRRRRRRRHTLGATHALTHASSGKWLLRIAVLYLSSHGGKGEGGSAEEGYPPLPLPPLLKSSEGEGGRCYAMSCGALTPPLPPSVLLVGWRRGNGTVFDEGGKGPLRSAAAPSLPPSQDRVAGRITVLFPRRRFVFPLPPPPSSSFAPLRDGTSLSPFRGRRRSESKSGGGGGISTSPFLA